MLVYLAEASGIAPALIGKATKRALAASSSMPSMTKAIRSLIPWESMQAALGGKAVRKTKAQVERAQRMSKAGKSERETATALKVPRSTVRRAVVARPMTFERLVAGYEGLFERHIASASVSLPPTEMGPCWGIDYYGTERLLAAVAAVPDDTRAALVTVLFWDNTVDTAARTYAPRSLRATFTGRPHFIINSYNLHTPEANLSHQCPQVLLGLLPTWSTPELETFAEMTRAYFEGLRQRVGDNALGVMLEGLTQDQDFRPTDFPPVGLKVSPELRDRYLFLVKEVLAKVSP